MEYIRLATIIKPHGLKGTLRCFSLTDFAKQRFKKGQKLSLFDENSNERRDVHVLAYREHNGLLYLDFEEIPSIEEAELLKGFHIEIEKDLAPMPEGFFRYGELIGCQVLDSKSKQVIGKVKDVLEYAPTKTLRIEREKGKDFFVPLIDSFVPTMDLENKTIEVEVVEGML